MYILPGYTTFYEEDGVIFVASKLLQNQVKIADPELQEEFRSIVRCGGCPEISTPLTQFLHEQELLANEAEITLLLNQAKKLLDDILLITIMPTEGCNFRCRYCYEDHVPISMRRETLDQIQAYIADQAPHFKTIQINWFGGEPTLCKDIVLETANLVQSLQAVHAFQYHSNMTTNGYLLNMESFQQFYEAGITSYQITLDGWNHDKTRPHVSGAGTLQTILSNLTAISTLPKERYQFSIVLRHNILAGDRDYSWYDELYKRFGADDRFSVLVRPVGDWGGESVHSLDILKGESREALLLEHIGYLEKIGMRHNNGSKGPFSKICNASYPHGMVFRPSGKIEKCTVCLDHPKNRLGVVDPEKGIILDPAVNALWSSFDLKLECFTCPDALSCCNMKCKMQSIINGREESSCSRALSAIF